MHILVQTRLIAFCICRQSVPPDLQNEIERVCTIPTIYRMVMWIFILSILEVYDHCVALVIRFGACIGR